MFRFGRKNKKRAPAAIPFKEPSAEELEYREWINFFDTCYPSYKPDEWVDDAYDKTDAAWFIVRNDDLNLCLQKYVEFKEISSHKNYEYHSLSYMAREAFEKLVFFVIKSPEQLPQDAGAYEALKKYSKEIHINILEKLQEGYYYDHTAEKYYCNEIFERWAGSVDDGATYGNFHIREVTESEARSDEAAADSDNT